MDELIDPLKLETLAKPLRDAMLTNAGLQGWLQQHYPAGLMALAGQPIAREIAGLIQWARSDDGMELLLQRLADHPPRPDLPGIVYALTDGRIKPESRTSRGLPPVPAWKDWFAANRPFVNRSDLRQHLESLDTSAGDEAILVIDGDPQTGKTFAVSMILGCRLPADRRQLDIDDFARFGRVLDAHELAKMIAGDGTSYSGYDPTKESESIPYLLDWLVAKLGVLNRWIIIDHCKRPALTDPARLLLVELAGKLRQGGLPGIRLILVDFDRNALPPRWRDYVRHERARLPDEACVQAWCAELAQAARRKQTEEQTKARALEVFVAVQGMRMEDGSWHMALERSLRKAHAEIMASEEQS